LTFIIISIIPLTNATHDGSKTKCRS